MTAGLVDVSVVVPVVERPEPLAPLYEEFAEPLRAAGYTYEFIFAVRQSHVRLTDTLQPLAVRGEPVRVLVLGPNVSETNLLKVGAAGARGRVLLTLPAYRQVAAAALPALVRAVADGVDVAVARRWPRRDSFINRLQNWVLHLVIGRLAGGKLHDVASGVRAMRPKVVEEARVYGDFVRFFPLLALREGFSVTEIESAVHPSASRARLYSPGVYVRRLIDIIGLTFLLRFTDKPLRFFGLVGGSLAAIGSLVLAVLFLQREFAGRAVADRPILLLGVLFLTLGVQAIALGLVGEMIVHLHASRRPLYRLRERRERERAFGQRRRVSDQFGPFVPETGETPLVGEHTQ
jgi:hypothetical protein